MQSNTVPAIRNGLCHKICRIFSKLNSKFKCICTYICKMSGGFPAFYSTNKNMKKNGI